MQSAARIKLPGAISRGDVGALRMPHLKSLFITATLDTHLDTEL